MERIFGGNMARMNAQIEIVFSKEIMELMSELLIQLNELADLIPEWQHLDAKKTCDRISEIMGKMLEHQRVSNNLPAIKKRNDFN